jgi:hypothetical protein
MGGRLRKMISDFKSIFTHELSRANLQKQMKETWPQDYKNSQDPLE